MTFDMKSLLYLVIVNTSFSLIKGDYLTINFVSNFFRNKNVMVTTNLCWEMENLKELLQTMSDHQRAIAIYKDPTDFSGIFEYLSTNNYFLIDLANCTSSWFLLKQANRENLFRYPLKWLLLITDDDTFEQLKTQLKTYSIYPTSDVIIAKRSANYYELLQPYRIDSTKDLIWENYGLWSEDVGLREPLHHIPFPQRRSNLQRAKMNVSMLIRYNDTWDHLDDFRYPQRDMFLKETWLSTKCLLEYCNVDYNLIQTDNFGYLNKTSGEWSGVIGDLYYGRAQIGGSAPMFTHVRAPAVEFLTQLDPTEIKFVMRRPPLSYMSNIFVLSFYWTVWVAIIVVLLLFAAISHVILNWETKYKKKINFQDRFGPNDILLILFEIVCQQGTMTEPRSVAGRTVSLVFLMGFMFIFVAYSANIVALLQSTTEITSLEQLLNSRITVAAEDKYYMKIYLTAAKDGIRKDLYQRKIAPAGFYSLEEGVERIRRGFFALHMELGPGYDYILRRFTDNEVCGLQELDGYMKSPGGHSCVPKNSPYKEVMKVGYLKIQEYGLRKRNFNRIYKKPKCHSQGGSFGSVGIMDAYPALLFWIYGIILALLILFMEAMLSRFKRKKIIKGSIIQPVI